MAHTFLLSIHIIAGAISILSGMAALCLRKGALLHRKFGNVFFYAMLTMSLSGAILAYFQPSNINLFMGLLTFYMVITAHRTAQNTQGHNGRIEIGAFVYILLLFAFGIIISMDVSATGMKTDGIPVPAYFVFTSIAGLALLLDVWILYRGGVYGKRRIVRHLWRMCYALFVATSSFFLGQAQVFPESIRDSFLLAVPVLIVVISLFYWLIRTWLTRQQKIA